MTYRETDVIRRIRIPPKVANVSGIVKGGIRQIVAAVQALECTIIIELPCDSARCYRLVICAEVAAIARVGEQWKSRRAALGRHADDACQRIRTIQRTVRLSQYLNLLNARCSKIPQLYCPANVIHWTTVDQHLRGISTA